MTLIVIFVFLGIFVIVGLVLLAGNSQTLQSVKQTGKRLQSLVASPGIANEESKTIDIRRAEGTSIPWLDKLLDRVAVVPMLGLLLYQAGMSWSPGKLAGWTLVSASIVGCSVYWRTASVLMSCALALVGGAAPLALVLKKRGRRFSAFEKDLPAALDLMVGAMRAGHSLNSAIGMVANETSDPISMEFQKVFDEQTFGLDLRAALLDLTERVPLHSVRIVVTAVLIQKETGGNLAEVLEKTAQVNRERFRLLRQVRVHTAQGRMTGWVLSLLPILLGVGLYLLDPGHVSTLWRTAFGLKMLYTAAGMTMIGGLLIRKIVNIRV
jgi:tight adherence protein B